MKVDIYNTDKKYDIIYADPPWQYKVWSKKGEGRSAESHYRTMNKQDLQNMGEVIDKISSQNAVLFLWVTAPCLIEGIQLIEKWGFTYKTIGFTWIKKNKKLTVCFGGWVITHEQIAELCLLATKALPRKAKNVHQVIMSKIEQHSKAGRCKN